MQHKKIPTTSFGIVGFETIQDTFSGFCAFQISRFHTQPPHVLQLSELAERMPQNPQLHCHRNFEQI